MKTKLLITAMALMATVAIANAQNNQKGTGQGNSSTFVDADKNGVCDNYENRNGNAQKGKAYNQGNKKGQKNGNGNKQGKGQGQGQGQGQGFVDKNNNGTCDNRE